MSWLPAAFFLEVRQRMAGRIVGGGKERQTSERGTDARLPNVTYISDGWCPRPATSASSPPLFPHLITIEIVCFPLSAHETSQVPNVTSV